MNLHARDRVGPYEIEGWVGAGAMGEVYRARDPRLGRVVAIKVLPASFASDPARRRRFEHEARATGLLSHPNVLAVHDVGDHEGAPYLVTELLEGETLRRRLQAGEIPVRKAVDYALQVARGLAAAHDKGIVHRDLKPENLFLTKDGIVKILDFGLARLERAPEPGSEATVTDGTGSGAVMGTAGYMSPEQARGETADHRTDLFSLGSVLYEMLSGRRAFHGDSSVETLNAILREEPPDLPAERQVPPAVDRLVRHCLEKKPEDRFQSARDLVYELEGLSGSSAAAGKTVQPGVVRVRRRWLVVVGGLGVVAALAAFGGGFLAGRRTAPSKIPTYRQLTFRRGLATSGRFTPDGKTVVYAASWDDAPGPEIFSVRIDAPESKPLGLPPGQVVGVSSKGELAVLLPQLAGPRSSGGTSSLASIAGYGMSFFGTLARVPLSGGTPRPVAEDVSCADWAPDGERLAALRFVEGRGQIEFPLGTVLARHLRASCPRFSPQGDRLAFGVPDGFSVLEPSSGRSLSITRIRNVEQGVAQIPGWWSWSPSGDEIWFTENETLNETALEAVSLSGRRRTLARIPGSLSVYDVSRDGLLLLEHGHARIRVLARAPGEAEERDLSVFDRTFLGDLSADGRLALLWDEGQFVAGKDRQFVYLRPTDGSPPMRLAEEGQPRALSPDGRWALVGPSLFHGRVPRGQGLRVVPTGAGEVRTIATPGLELGPFPDWLADGKRILLWGREADRGWRTYVVDTEGGAPRALTPEGVVNCVPGRQRVACLGPRNRVTFYPLEGGEPREVPGIALEPGVWLLRLSEDERSLIVGAPRTTRTSPRRVERIGLATGRRTLLHELRPADMGGVIYFAGRVRVTPDGRGYAYGYQQYLHTLYVADGFQ